MSKIRLEKQRQVTLPVEIVEQAGIRQDDLLEVSYASGAITLRPVRASDMAMPTKSIMDYAGSCRGAWGSTPEEIESNLAADRESWDR
jgi:bifunctional DNA-binding transcriptional regulator/antitoxin component of YhaV-PrlF toxin-antitoxin module